MSRFGTCFAWRYSNAGSHMRSCAAGCLLLFAASVQLHAEDPIVAIRARKAMLTTEVVMHFEGDTKGLGRTILEGALGQCNDFRQKVYHLPAQTLPEDVLHSVDTGRHEYLFDGTGYALSKNMTRGVELTDMLRWHKELAAGNAAGKGTMPDRAPDCSVYERGEVTEGYLWREGKYYRLDYKRKRASLDSVRRGDATPRFLDPPVVGKQFPQEVIAGQSCSVTRPTQSLLGGGIGADEQCDWNDFGAVAWMNLPLGLRRTLHFGQGKRQIWDVRTETADDHPKFDSDTFAIPNDFTVVGH